MGPYIEIPENENRRFQLQGQTKTGKTRALTGTGTGLACQEVEGRAFGQFWNQTEPLIEYKPRPLAGCPDSFLTLNTSASLKRSHSDDNILGNRIMRGTATPHIGSAARRIHDMQCLIHIPNRQSIYVSPCASR